MKYHAINAKVAGMNAKLLLDEDYSSISNARTAHEAMNLLKSHETYAHLDNDWTSFGAQTFSLLEDDYAKISNFINDMNIKKYLRSVLEKRRVALLKQELRIAYGVGKSTDAVIEAPQGDRFHDFLKSTIKSGAALSQIEILLDLNYYTNLWKARSRYLSGADKVAMTLVNGTEIDMYNLARILGLKKHYKTSGEQMYKYVLPINYKVVPQLIQQLIEADNEVRIRELIGSTSYGEYFAAGNTAAAFNRAINDANRRAVCKNPDTIAKITYYLHRKEAEISNIISIMETINYARRCRRA